MIGRNAIYFEDYVLAIQYFNQIIKAKPYLAEPYYYRAIAKFYLDDYQGAEDDCTNSIERNPFLTDAFQLRADAKQYLKDYKGATADYTKSLESKPNDKIILINLGIVNILDKNFEPARKYLDKLIITNPNYTEGYLTRANYYLETKDTLKAREDIDTAILKDKYFAPSYSMKASIDLMQKKYDESISNFDEAIKLDPITTNNYINRGLAKYYKNDLRGAMSDYDHVLDIDNTNLIAHFNRALLRSQVGDDNRAIEDFNYVLKYEPDNYIAYMNRSLLKQNIGDIRGALADLNIVLKQYPNFYQGYQLRSDIKRKQNDLAGAEVDYNKARGIENKLRKEILAGKTPDGIDKEKNTREISDNSIDKFDRLVVADKNDENESRYKSNTRGKVQNRQAKTDLLALFAISYYEKGNELQKFTRYNKELENLNRNKDILQEKLVITNQQIILDSIQIQKHFESINRYSNLIEGNSINPILYFARSIDYEFIQDYNSSIEDLEKAIYLDPNFTLAYFNLAITRTKLLKAKINNPELYNNKANRVENLNNVSERNLTLGDYSVNINQNTNSENDNILDTKTLAYKLEYDQIILAYNKTIQLDSDFVYAYYNRAEIKVMQEDYRGAILDYNEAIRKDSDFAEAYYNRGLCRLKLKDNTRGLDDLRKAGELGIIGAYSLIKQLTD